MKSWAIPKGPSTDPQDKRLAVPTEDHPLEYAGFEGVIPAGEYGGGTVLVWDTGIYRNLTEKKGEVIPMGQGLAHGHVKVWLEGNKLTGGYALTRFKTGKDESWLLVKADDAKADRRRNPVADNPARCSPAAPLKKLAVSADCRAGIPRQGGQIHTPIRKHRRDACATRFIRTFPTSSEQWAVCG